LKFADTHAHLTWKSFDNDREDVIARARSAGVCLLIDCGIDARSNSATLELSSAHDWIHSTLGFQPSRVPELTDGELESEMTFIEKNLHRALALGEVGLDYHWVKDAAGRRRQKEFLRRCCTVAKGREVPLVIHSRKSESDCMDIIEEAGLTEVVLHCFSGNAEELKRAVDAGYCVSIPTSVCYSRSHQRSAVAVPDDLLLLETDCPFLSPHRGERNEPAFVVEAYETVAGLRGCRAGELGGRVIRNARRIFHMK